MKNIPIFFILSFFFFSGYSQTWKDYDKQFDELYAKGEYEKAFQVVQKALDAARKEFGENHQNYAGSLDDLGTYYLTMGQYDKAEPLYLQALEIRKKTIGDTHPDYSGNLNNLAMLYEKVGKYEKAEPLLIEAIEIRKKMHDDSSPGFTSALNNLGLLYYSMGQYQKAEKFFLQTIETKKKVHGETLPDYALSLSNLGSLYNHVGQYTKAGPLLVEAISIWKTASGEISPDYRSGVANLAQLYKNTGQFEKGEPLFIQSVEITKKLLGENHPDYGTALLGLAAFYQETGQYQKAEPLFIRGTEILKRSSGEFSWSYGRALSDLGTFYIYVGQYEKAISLLSDGLEIAKKTIGENSREYATVTNNLASVYEKTGGYDQAETLHKQAMEIQKKSVSEINSEYALELNSLGVLYYQTGQYQKAEPVYLRSTEIFKKTLGENHPLYAISLNNLAELYESMGEYAKAEPLFIQAIEVDKKALGESHPAYATDLNNLALFYNNTGEYEKAQPLLLSVNKIKFNNLNNTFGILSEKEKGNYLVNNIFLIDGNNSFLYNYKNASGEMKKSNFNQLLFFKSLTLSSTQSMLGSVQKSKDTSIQRIFAQWQDNKRLLAKQYSLSASKRISDIHDVEAITENLEKELNSRSSAFREQQTEFNVSMTDVQRNLQPDEAAVEFVRFNLFKKKTTDSIMYAAYILRKNDSVPIFVPLCEEKQLQKLFDSAGTVATNMANTFYRGAHVVNGEKSNSNTALGKRLFELMWKPMEPYLKAIKKISYSPAGKLFSIAFHALPVDKHALLIDKYELHQYFSTREISLRTSENTSNSAGEIVLIGDPRFTMDSAELVTHRINKHENDNISVINYNSVNRSGNGSSWANLPGTGSEVKKISYLFRKNNLSAQVFINDEASEENLKALSGHSPEILHIATHGFFLPEPDKKNIIGGSNGNVYTLSENPMLRSGLVLAGANFAWSGNTPVAGVEDGIATAYEISQLNLNNTKLVVLSACETALGEIKGSEGVFGLQRAFKMAGVKQMIVSLWSVPDKETAELMTLFYTNWIKGNSMEKSFATAQSEMRKKHSAYYWAAFVLID